VRQVGPGSSSPGFLHGSVADHEAPPSRVMSIVKFVIRTFVLHVSITKPLGESGKLQLTSDMTELEFALSAFMVENPQSKRGGNLDSIGEEYWALRAMRFVFVFYCPPL
jgi:hypothetical protein